MAIEIKKTTAMLFSNQSTEFLPKNSGEMTRFLVEATLPLLKPRYVYHYLSSE